jgi:hypothetical protein
VALGRLTHDFPETPHTRSGNTVGFKQFGDFARRPFSREGPAEPIKLRPNRHNYFPSVFTPRQQEKPA